MSFLKKHFWVFVLFLSFWAIQPFFARGFFPMHDDTQVARVFEMGKSLTYGMFPVRWVFDLGYGYGYPIFNFYAPLAYYVGGLFTLLGFDALVSTKIMMALGVLFSGVFMYFFSREFFGKAGGFVSSLLYLYAPYHAVDIFVRGDVAEFWAYAFIPLVFLSVYKAIDSKKWLLIGSISYAFLILSHNLTALMVTPFLFIFYLVLILSSDKKRTAIYSLSSSIFLGLLLSAFYWVPALLESHYINVISQIGGGADFRDHFVCLPQLWNSPWGFGGSARGCIDGMSLMIGKFHIILSTLFLFILFLVWKEDKKKGYILLFCFCSLLIGILMTLELSKPLWEAISPMAYFQYPWRFLLLISFFSSFIGGSFFWFLQKRKKMFGLLLTILFAFFFLSINIKHFIPQRYLNKTAVEYTNKEVLNFETSRISDEYLPSNIQKPQLRKDSFTGTFSKSSKATSITVANQKILFQVKSFSLIRLDETSLERIFDFVSLGSLIVLFGILYRMIFIHEA